MVDCAPNQGEPQFLIVPPLLSREKERNSEDKGERRFLVTFNRLRIRGELLSEKRKPGTIDRGGAHSARQRASTGDLPKCRRKAAGQVEEVVLPGDSAVNGQGEDELEKVEMHVPQRKPKDDGRSRKICMSGERLRWNDFLIL